MLKSRPPARFIPPMAVLAAAILIALAALFVRRDAEAVSTPIDLKSGTVQTVEFRAAYDEQYAIGIEMDQQAAKRLFPCMADGSSSSFGHCAENEFPLSLSLALSANGADLSGRVQRDTSTAGGQYVGHETFTRNVAYVRLSRGNKYRLTVRSEVDGSELAEARPRLLVRVEQLALKGEMVMRATAILLAKALALVAAIWAVTVLVLDRMGPSRTKRTNSASHPS